MKVIQNCNTNNTFSKKFHRSQNKSRRSSCNILSLIYTQLLPIIATTTQKCNWINLLPFLSHVKNFKKWWELSKPKLRFKKCFNPVHFYRETLIYSQSNKDSLRRIAICINCILFTRLKTLSRLQADCQLENSFLLLRLHLMLSLWVPLSGYLRVCGILSVWGRIRTCFIGFLALFFPSLRSGFLSIVFLSFSSFCSYTLCLCGFLRHLLQTSSAYKEYVFHFLLLLPCDFIQSNIVYLFCIIRGFTFRITLKNILQALMSKES